MSLCTLPGQAPLELHCKVIRVLQVSVARGLVSEHSSQADQGNCPRRVPEAHCRDTEAVCYSSSGAFTGWLPQHSSRSSSCHSRASRAESYMVAGFLGVVRISGVGFLGFRGFQVFPDLVQASSFDFAAFAAFRPRAVVQHGTCPWPLPDDRCSLVRRFGRCWAPWHFLCTSHYSLLGTPLNIQGSPEKP